MEDPFIHQLYWNLLSKQIVLAGVKTIQIFYEDANKEMEIVQFPTHVVSFNKCDIPFICSDTIVSPFGELSRIADAAGKFLSSAINTTKNILASVGSTVKNIFGGSGGFNQAGEIDLSGENNFEENNVSANSQNKEIQKSKSKIKNSTEEINTSKNNADENQKNATSTIKNIQTAGNKAGTCDFNSLKQPFHSGVIINEIAWMGSVNSAADEWIELKNVSNSTVNLSDWRLLSKDGDIKINLSELKTVSLQPGKFILLERTDNSSALGVSASIIYTGALSNSSEILRLFDSSCNLIDEVSANSDWPAGDNSAKKTMERNTDNSSLSLSNQFGWHTSASAGGTPKKKIPSSKLFILAAVAGEAA